MSSWSWSHSPIDNCSLSIRPKVNINHKQLAANTGYAATHYGNPGVSIYSFFSRSAKPVGGYKQLFNKLCINFLNGNRWNGFLPSCSCFCNCTKNPNSQYASEASWQRGTGKMPYRDSATPLQCFDFSFIQFVRALTVLIDVWHVKSRSPSSFLVGSNKIKSARFIVFLRALLIKQSFHLRLLDMMWLQPTRRYSPLISNTHSWNNC